MAHDWQPRGFLLVASFSRLANFYSFNSDLNSSKGPPWVILQILQSLSSSLSHLPTHTNAHPLLIHHTGLHYLFVHSIWHLKGRSSVSFVHCCIPISLSCVGCKHLLKEWILGDWAQFLSEGYLASSKTPLQNPLLSQPLILPKCSSLWVPFSEPREC